MRIELASKKDIDEFYELYQYAARRKNQYGDRAWRDGFSREWASRTLDEGAAYVGKIDNKIVAAFALEWSDDIWSEHEESSAGYVHRLAVAEGFHGQGIGKNIIDWAAGVIKKENRQFIRLDCPAANKSLTEYYLKLSFELIEVKEIPEYGAVVNMLQKPV
jgi:GNAT superfamily N-acetyltransferase